MNSHKDIIFQTMGETLSPIRISKSTLYKRIKDGLMPPPVNIGLRAVRFLKHENNAVFAAMAAGQSKEEIKILVKNLIKERKTLTEMIK